MAEALAGAATHAGELGGASTLIVGGERFRSDATGALAWPNEKALIVADLHFEKATAFADRGRFLPPYDTTKTLRLLERAIVAHQPRLVIALGDSFHDVGGPARLSADNFAHLKRLQRHRRWIWVVGNHDPELPADLGGEIVDAVNIRHVRLQHEPWVQVGGFQIAGHLHPCARVAGKGASVRRPCFIADDKRIIIPAFGALTGGLNILDQAFDPLFSSLRDCQVHVLGAERVYPVPTHQLRPDRTEKHPLPTVAGAHGKA